MGEGHGHVTPRADGAKARCGGPALCAVCAAEQFVVDHDGRYNTACWHIERLRELLRRMTVATPVGSRTLLDTFDHQLNYIAEAVRHHERSYGLGN